MAKSKITVVLLTQWDESTKRYKRTDHSYDDKDAPDSQDRPSRRVSQSKTPAHRAENAPGPYNVHIESSAMRVRYTRENDSVDCRYPRKCHDPSECIPDKTFFPIGESSEQ